MARERKVTRTIISTKATVMVANTTTAEIETHTLDLAGTFKDDKAILKFIEKMDVLPAECKAVQILASENKETIYGMTEQDFIKLAHVLDSDRNFVDEDEEAEPEAE